MGGLQDGATTPRGAGCERQRGGHQPTHSLHQGFRAAQPACQARLQFFSIPFPYQYFCLLRDTSRVFSQLKGEFEQVSRKAVMFLCFLSIQNTSVVLTMRSPS